MNKFTSWMFAGAFVLGFAGAPAQAQQATVVRVRGAITVLDGQVLAVKTREGKDVQIQLTEKTPVNGVWAISVNDVKPGDYVGAAAMNGADGKLVALEVLVFPEAARGSNEGHYPWDLQPDSTMTNATVTATVNVNNGRELIVNYNGGQQTILVPESVPVVTFAPADRSLLKSGALVFIPSQVGTGGGLSALRVFVGRDGLKPPM